MWITSLYQGLYGRTRLLLGDRITWIQLTKKDPDVRSCFLVPYDPTWSTILYDQTDFLQVQGHVALCCPADLNTNSAALRYILRECGIENIFQLRPKVGEDLTIPASSFLDNQIVHLLIKRPSQYAAQITDDFFLCLEHLKALLLSNETPDIHFPIVDPERPLRSLDNFYHSVMDVFAGTGITVILHDRVYVSIASIGQFLDIT